MATEANISEPVYIKEKEEVNVNFNPHDINHPPETGDHLMKSEKVQELGHDGFEAKQVGLKANMEVLEGEKFLKSPSIAMVDSQETCQDLDLSPQTAKERPESGEENERHEVSEVEEEMLTDKIETLKEKAETAERNERDFEIVDDKGTGYQEEESVKVLFGAEEDKTSKEEKALEENGGDINSLASAEEKQENIQKQISSLQISEEVEKKIDENAETAADEELSRHEAKLGEFKEAPIYTPDPTIDNLETGAETFKVSISEQESGDTSARSDPKVSEEIIGRKVVDGLVEKETCCLEEKDPAVVIPIRKTENDKEGIAFSTVGETSSMEEATPGVDIDKEASSEIREGMMCELDIASISPATDFSSTQQTVSKVEDKLGQLSGITSNEEEENKVESSRHIKDVNVAVDQRQEKQKIETPIVTQGDHMCPQKEDNSDIVNIVSVEPDSHDHFKNDPPESEILGETVLADSVSGHTVISAEDIRTSVEHNKEETSKLEENQEEFSKEQYGLENEMNLPPRELDEEIKVLILDKNINDLKQRNSLEPEAELVEDSKLEEACDIHSQNQVQEVKKVSKVEEMHVQNESEAHGNKLEPEGTGKIPQTENMHNVAESDSEVKLESQDSVMNVEDKTQEIENSISAGEHIERSNTEEVPPIEVISTDAETSQAESLQQAAASTLRGEVEETIKTTGVKSDEVHNGPKMIGSRDATDEQNTITDDSIIESLRNTGRKAEILDEQDIVSQRTGDDTIKGSSQEYADEGPSKNFKINDVDAEKLSRKDYEGSETDGSIVDEIDRSANLTFQFSVVNDQESLKGERSTGEEAAQEKLNDHESNSEPSEVQEEIKEALKHEEEVEEKLQNYEPGENIERSNKALFPDSEADKCSETAYKPRGKKADGPEESAEAEMPKVKDTDGQLADMSNIKYLSQESDKEEMVNNFQTSETNAHISNKENVEESENVGTGQSSASETNHDDEGLNPTLATSLVEETEIVQDKSKSIARSEASSGEKKEENVSAVQAVEGNVSSVRLEEANQNSKETTKCEETNEPEEVENTAILMAVDNEASASNEKATDDAEEIQNVEENTVEGGEEGIKDTDGTEVESVAMKEANQNNETAEYEAEVTLGKNKVEEIESSGVSLTIETEALISSEETIDENEDIQNDEENTMQEKKEGIEDETEPEKVAVKEKANRNSEETTECEAQVELAKNEVKEIVNSGILPIIVNEAPISNEKTIDKTEYIQNVKEEEEANQKREEATESEGHVELEKDGTAEFENSGIPLAIENDATVSNEMTIDETEYIQNVKEDEEANQNRKEITEGEEHVKLEKNEAEGFENSGIPSAIENEAPISNENTIDKIEYIQNVIEDKEAAHNREETSESEAHVEFEKNEAAEFENSGTPLAIENDATVSNEMTIDETEYIQNVKEDEEANQNRKEITEGEEHVKLEKNEAEEFENSGIPSAIENEAPISNENTIDKIEYIQNVIEDKEAAHNREETSESEAHVEFEKNEAAEFENSGTPLAIENEAPISEEKTIDETEYIQNVKEEEEANRTSEEATESKTFVELKRNEAEDFENSGIPSAIENEALLSNKNTIDETEDTQNVEEKKAIGMMVTDETEGERVAVKDDVNQNSEETTKYGDHALQDLQKNEPEEIENSALQALGNEAPISNEKKTDDALGILNIEEKKEEGAKDTNEIKVERVAVKEVAQVVEETSNDRRGEKAEGPEENAEAEMSKVKDTDGQLADESNIKSLSLESTEEEMVNNFQTSETNALISNKENVEESENAGTGQSSASKTNHDDESLNSTLATSLVEETEIVQDKSKNMARSEVSSGEKKEENVSQAVEGNVSSIRLEEANQNSKETAKCEENNEPEEVENSAILMAVDNEASASNEKATDDAEEIQNVEENTVEGGKEGVKDTDGTKVESVAMKEANQNNDETAEYEAEVKLGKNEVEEIESSGVPLTIENEAPISSWETIDENEDIQNVEENTVQEKKEEGIKDETKAERVAVKEKANRNSEETTECEAQVELAKNKVEEIGNTGVPPVIVNEAPISNEKTIDETEYIQNVKEEEDANQKREEETESEGHVELEKNEVEDFKNSGIPSAIENGAPLSNEKTTDETEDIQNVEEKKEVGMKVTDETEVERVAVKEDANQNSEETTNYGEHELQDLQKNEPEEIENSALQVLGNEAPISNEKETHDPLGILNIEEKKDEGAKDTNEIKVERVAVKEVAQAVEETSNDRSTVDEKPITSETEVEKLENAYGADSTEKVEEETKDEETKEKHGSEKNADFIKDSETQTLMEEHTGTNISRLSTEEIALSCRPDEAEGKSKEEILEEPDKIRAAKDPENEANKLNERIIEQRREIVTEDDVKLMMPKQEEQEVICTIDEVHVKQIIHENEKFEISQEKLGENPLQQEKEFENDVMELKEEVKELNSEATASVEATVSELLTDKEEHSSGLHSAEVSEDLTLSKETSESHISVSIPKSDSKELSGKVQPEAHECSCESVRELTEERSPTGPELPTSDMKEPIITDTKETTLMGGDIDVKPENFSHLVEKNDSPILVVTSETEEESRHEVSNDATLAGRETEKELVAAETPSCSTLDAKESEKSEAIERIDENLKIDQNAHDNAINPLVPQSTASTRDEDKTVNAQEVATLGSLDTGNERTTEKVQYYQSENVQEHHDLQTEAHTLKQEETELTNVEEIRDPVIEGESGKSKTLDYVESSLLVASLESSEPTSADRKVTNLQEENPLNISEVNLQEGAAPQKGDREIEKGNQKQEVEAADPIKCHGQTEENLRSVESGEKLERVGERDKSDQSNISTYEVKPNTIEEINSENKSQCLDSIEKRFQESQTDKQGTEEMAEPELEVEVSSRELQNTDETTKAVISVEQVKEDVEETDGDETLKHTLVESNNKKELQSESAVDDTIDEVKESTEDPVAKDSTEQTEIMNLNSQVQPPLKQEKSAIKGKEEENAENEVSKKPIGSVTVVAEEPEELIKEKIVDEGNRCSKEINVADAAEVKPASGSEVTQIDDKIVHISNITSDEIKADTFESERSQQNIIDTRILEDSSSHLASQISADDPENLTNDNVVPKHADGSKNLFDTVNELKGTDKKGLLTGDIEEEIKELSETVPTSQDIEEIATKEVLADENLQEQISYHQIASSTLPSQEEGPGTEATVENVEERTIQVVKMNDEDPNEMHEEAVPTSDEIGEKKEACESSEDIKIIKHDLTASPETMHVKKSEEQYQTTSAVLLPEDMEYKRSETTASSGEENNVKVLESKPRTSENPRIFEEPKEDDTPQLDVQLGKDEQEENAIESRQEGSSDPDSHKIEEINEQASELAADSNSKYLEIVADDIVTSSQTPAVENFEEKNEAPPSVLHLKDTDHGTLVATEKIEEVEVLKDGLATAEDPSLQKEELREAEVLPMELPFQKDIQKELIEEPEERGREANEVHRFEEIKEDKIIIPKQKSEELSQTQTDSLLPKEQDTTTDAVQNTKEQQVKIATREVTEEPRLQKGKTEDLQVSGLEFQHKKDDKKENMYQPQEDEIRTAEMLELCPKDLESKTKDSDCTTEIEKIPEMMGPIEATSEHMTKATNEDLQYMSEAPSHEPADQSEETVSRDKHQEEALADATEIINDEAKEEEIADATEIIRDKAKEEALADATEITHDEAKEQALADATEIIHDEAIEKEILEKKVILGEAIAERSNQEHRVNAEEKQMQSGEINKEIQEGDTSKKSEEQISSDHSSCQKFHREEINEQASELAAESNSKYFEIVADDVVTSSQTPAVENFEEKNEAPPSVLHSKDTDHGLVATEKIEEVEILKDGLAPAEDRSLQKQELGEAEVLTMELPLKKDIQEELIEEREEQGREANEVHRFEEIKEDNIVIPTQKSEELRQTKTASLLPKEQDTTMEAVQNTEEQQVKIATRDVTEEPCSQKEKTEDLQVSGLEFQRKKDEDNEHMYQAQEYEIRTAEMLELCPKDLESKTKDSECTTEIMQIPEMTGPKEATSEHRTKATNEVLQSVSEAPSHEPADQSEETASRDKHQEEALADATEIINDEAKEEALPIATEIIHDEAKEEALADATEIIHDEAKEEAVADATEIIHDEAKKEALADATEIIHSEAKEQALADATEIKHDEAKEQALAEATEIKHDEAIEKEILVKKETVSTSPSVILGEAIAEGSNQEHRVNTEEKQMQSGEINKEIQGDTSKKSEEQISSDHSSCQKFHHEVVWEMCKTEPVLLVSEVERGIEIAQNEGSLDLAKANETIPDIDHGKKISDAISQEQFSTGKVGVPQVQQGLIVETIQNVDVGNLEPENVRMVDAVIKGPEEGKMDDKTEKSVAETVAEDSGNEEVKAETEKPKSEDEEEGGGEQEKADSGPAAPVMVEATKGMEVKVEHKKSHNILAGVGSKVKHSISKVKKAIIGKSSHPKQHSPTKTK